MKEKIRLSVAIAGIAFADILMFFQLGMLDALFDGAEISSTFTSGSSLSKLSVSNPILG